MGCISSKQKKTEVVLEKKLTEINVNDVSSTSTSKSKRPAKPAKTAKLAKQPRSKSKTPKKKSRFDDLPNDTNEVKLPVQRSITPPPVRNESKQPKKSKSSRKTWTDEELLCQLKFLDFDTSSNIVRLFDEGNTIPFMCRYRRELIGNRDADE